MVLGPGQILILDIADFRGAAARRPELAKAAHDEAERRPVLEKPARKAAR